MKRGLISYWSLNSSLGVSTGVDKALSGLRELKKYPTEETRDTGVSSATFW